MPKYSWVIQNFICKNETNKITNKNLKSLKIKIIFTFFRI
jgi:hypothetical protein